VESPAVPPSPEPPPPPALPEPPARARPPRFDPPNILWYFGGISATAAANAVVGDMGAAHRGLWIFLVALVFLAGAAGLCAWVLSLGCWVPAGVLTTSAVALVPAVVVGFEHLIGVWPKHPEARNPFRGFEGFVFAPAAATVAAGLLAFWLVRFGFVLLPVTVAAALCIQFLLPALVSHPSVGDNMTTLLITGAGFVVIGMLLDARRHRNPAFWWHAVGLFAIANGLVYYVGVNPLLPGDHSSLWAWVTMLVVGAALVVAAFPVGRATWATFGVAGVYAPALHYVDDASGAWRVPLLMVFVGLGLMVVGAILDVVGPTWPQRLSRPALRTRT
jgi:hypothetical protein